MQPPVGSGGAIRVVGAAIVAGRRCLVAQRGPGMSSPGRWEFPGGKVEAGERPEDALARELQEELGVEVAVGLWVGRGEAPGRSGRVVLDVYLARLVRGEARPLEHAEVRWVGAPELATLEWAAADVPVVPRVAAALRASRCGR